jgi:hypothetical protein
MLSWLGIFLEGSMRRSVLAAFFATAFAACAQAAPVDLMSPQNEGNVVEFQVFAVTLPALLPGQCTVTAMVDRVWQGGAYHYGQPLLLSVPCAEYGLISANAWSDGFTPVNARTLEKSSHGIARISDKGELIWHHAGLRQYGQWGAVAGYRVLDLRMLPVHPS